MAIWWGSFWSNPEKARQWVKKNYSANEDQIGEIITSLSTEWDQGNTWEAGQSFGEFWVTLIGKPVW